MLQTTELFYLTELSPGDKSWDKHKAQADDYKTLYLGTLYHKRAERIASCSNCLVFKTQVPPPSSYQVPSPSSHQVPPPSSHQVPDNRYKRYKLKSTWFCRVPHCPICQGRRALKWNSKTRQIMPKVLEEFPKSEFIMLTLTVPNCDLAELRLTLDQMHKAWRRLLTRKELAKIQGWVRSTEVNRSQEDTTHPHYHALLMVEPSYFTGANYITQKRWSELWAKSLKTNEIRVVDVRKVKPKKGLESQKTEAILSATTEVIKYAVKPSDNLIDEHDIQRPGQRVRMSNQDWLVGLTDQLHKSRLIATGGVLKDYFKELEDERQEERQDLVHIRENVLAEPDYEEPDKVFNWHSGVKRYAMRSQAS